MTESPDESRPEDHDAEEAQAEEGREARAEDSAPEQSEAEAGGSEPEAAEEPEPEAAEEPEPEAAEEPEPEAEGGESEKPRGEEPAQRRERDRDQPPGAELDPIAIPERELSAEEQARLEAEAEERAAREAVATAEEEEEIAPRREPAAPLEGGVRVQATGKRKTAIARVLVRPGAGSFVVNERNLDDYFPALVHRATARHPLVAAGYEEAVDVRVRVHGGGIAGQAGAVRHGIARALCDLDPNLRSELKKRGMLTRDARAKERRKAGLKKARKRPQFSKR